MKSKGLSIITSILSIIFSLLLIVAVVRMCYLRTDVLTFKGLLDILHQVPVWKLENIGSIWHADGNWLILEPLRWLLNLLGVIIGFSIFIFSNLWNILAFIWFLFMGIFAF